MTEFICLPASKVNRQCAMGQSLERELKKEYKNAHLVQIFRYQLILKKSTSSLLKRKWATILCSNSLCGR